LLYNRRTHLIYYFIIELRIGTEDTSRFADQLRISATYDGLYYYRDIQGRESSHQKDHEEESGRRNEEVALGNQAGQRRHVGEYREVFVFQ